MRYTHPPFLLASSAVLALTISACAGGSDSDGADTPPDTSTADAAPAEPEEASDDGSANSVGILQSRFDPLEVSISVGETVTFTNNDPFAHTVTSRDDSEMQFDSGDFGQDETFELTFDEAGSFAYFCEIHPTMRATVVVS